MSIFMFQGASKRTKAVTGIAMSLFMIFQAVGPGVFAVNTAHAIENPNDSATIVANKIVCDNEADLPNWGLGNGPDITSTTASDWIAAHPDCHAQANWQFQYELAGNKDYSGDAGRSFTGPAGAPWTTFTNPTDANGHTSQQVSFLNGTTSVFWVREVLQPGYIPFTYDQTHKSDSDNVSAEMYCNVDHLHYDNFDQIGVPQNDHTYYCVAWNVSTTVPCLTPVAAAPSDKITSFGVSSPELSLQQVFNNAYPPAGTINATSSETGIQTWNIPVGETSITVSGKFIAGISASPNEFGYYFDNDISTFTPIFKDSTHTGSSTLLAPGDAIPSTVINTTGHTSIGFAIDSQINNTSTHQKFATQASLNSGGEDHAVVYHNPSNDKGYVIGFEDWLFSTGSDKDYQDMVVELDVDSCTQGGNSCTPASGTVVSDNTVANTTDGGNAVALTTINPNWTANIPGATWIWATDPVVGPTNTGTDLTKVFTKTFTIPGTPTSGTLDIAVDNNYTVTVNGNTVPVVFDQNNFQAATQDSYDVTPFLVTGTNTIVITATNEQDVGESPDPAANPAGVLFSLAWNSDCGGGGGGNTGTNVQVHIAKYLDGSPATANSADSYAFPMASSWNDPGGIGSGSGTYTLSPTGFGPSGDTTVGPYQADTSIMKSGATYSTNERTNDMVGSSDVLPYGATCVAGDYELDGYGVSAISFADAFAHVQAPTGPSDHPSFNSGLNNDEYVVVANHTCATTPPAPVGNIEITKYECPVATTVTRTNNGVEGTVPTGCVLETGATFGYVHGTQTDANSPYPELSAPITEAGTTTNGDLTISGLPATGRYLVMETDGNGTQLGASDILGLYCTGDGDTTGTNDNQELTFVTDGQTTHCVAYNKMGTLTIIKHVDNDPEGGTLQASDFTLDVTGNNPSESSVTGAETPGTTIDIGHGSYAVTEADSQGYTISYSPECSGIMTAGGSATCTVTNTDNPPPGTDFTLTVTLSGDGTGSVLGDQTANNINCSDIPGSDEQSCVETYPSGTVVNLAATPNEDSNFNDTWSGACSGNGACQVTMNINQSVNAHFGLNSTTPPGGGGGGGGCGTTCNTNSGGGGGFSSGGGHPLVLGASTNNSNSPQVLGANTDIPNLPDTGKGDNAQGLEVMLTLMATLFLLNFGIVKLSRKG